MSIFIYDNFSHMFDIEILKAFVVNRLFLDFILKIAKSQQKFKQYTNITQKVINQAVQDNVICNKKCIQFKKQ